MRAPSACACALALGLASPACAWFESSPLGARALGLGESFVSVADDPSALYWNPAGLVQLRRHEVFVSYERRPDLEGLESGFAAVIVHSGVGSFGLGWQHTGLEETIGEDLVYLSLAHTAVRRSLGAFVSAAATLKVAHLDLERGGFSGVAGLRGSATALAADVGFLLAPIPNVTAGAIVRNLGRPQFDLLAGGERTTLENETEWGVSLRWREDGWLALSRVQHPGSAATTTKLGVEVRLAPELAVQVGMRRDAVSAGVGVDWKTWRFDSGLEAQDLLGVKYRVALRRGFGHERQPIGGGFEPF